MGGRLLGGGDLTGAVQDEQAKQEKGLLRRKRVCNGQKVHRSRQVGPCNLSMFFGTGLSYSLCFSVGKKKSSET